MDLSIDFRDSKADLESEKMTKLWLESVSTWSKAKNSACSSAEKMDEQFGNLSEYTFLSITAAADHIM